MQFKAHPAKNSPKNTCMYYVFKLSPASCWYQESRLICNPSSQGQRPQPYPNSFWLAGCNFDAASFQNLLGAPFALHELASVSENQCIELLVFAWFQDKSFKAWQKNRMHKCSVEQHLPTLGRYRPVSKTDHLCPLPFCSINACTHLIRIFPTYCIRAPKYRTEGTAFPGKNWFW